MIAISAKNAQYLQKLFSAVEDVVDSAQHPPGTGVLNRLLHRTVENSPAALGRSGKSFNLLYATIAKDEEPRAIPVPTFILFANRADKLQDSYLRHLEDVIRTGWPAPGVPFRFSVRGKEKRGAEAGAEGRPKPPGEAKSPRKAATVPRRPDKPRRGAGRITGGMQRHRGKTDRGR
jgi:GTP-binding protein